MAGWVTEISAEERTNMWWGALEAIAGLHRLDVTSRTFDFLNQFGRGAPGLQQRLCYYEDYLNWAYDGPQPTARAALNWLQVNQPVEPPELSVLWGDARLGNVVFSDGVPRALLDWEMATLGQPEEDLAWFIFSDCHLSEGIGASRLNGFPNPSDTVRVYQELIGRPLCNMKYYEVLSAFKLAIMLARIGQLMINSGSLERASDFPYHNQATSLLARILGLRTPRWNAADDKSVR